MNRVLILFAHPSFHKSRVNRQMIAAVQNLEQVTFHDLYETYPNFLIDARAEQALLKQHDVVVFQHPLYWFSAPAIIKEWCDLVLEFGFAYGDGGDQLVGKSWVHALTAGVGREAYQVAGVNRFRLRDFLLPFEQSAHVCGMHFLPPFAAFNTYLLGEKDDIPAIAQQYREVIIALRDTSLAISSVKRSELLNEPLNMPTAITQTRRA